ncbi:MAG: hypothetical protein K8R99_01530 [Actinomycetia bacterium]|nr:hypothetical protein [Actinomycetes bacterium]
MDDVSALKDSGLTYATVKGTRYLAADLQIDSTGNFLTGLLGFAEDDVLRQFDSHSFSWLKGEVESIYGATRQMVVPFALDMREKRRWVAHATTARIKSRVFRQAFAATLNHAVGELGLLPSEWEVDPVMSLATVEDWLGQNKQVVSFKRVIRLTNPLSDVDEARRKMRRLNGRVEERVMRGTVKEPLQLHNNPAFAEEIGPVATGDMEIELRAKSGGTSQWFKSEDHTDHTSIPEYGHNLDQGVALVLDALVRFSDRRGDVSHEPMT